MGPLTLTRQRESSPCSDLVQTPLCAAMQCGDPFGAPGCPARPSPHSSPEPRALSAGTQQHRTERRLLPAPTPPPGSPLDILPWECLCLHFIQSSWTFSVYSRFPACGSPDAVLGRLLKYLLFAWEEHLSGQVWLAGSQLFWLQVTQTQGWLCEHSHRAPPRSTPISFMLLSPP